MIYQILPKHNYRFSTEQTKLFLSTLISIKRDKFSLRKIISQINQVMINEFIIDCDEHGHINYYYKINSDSTEQVRASLETLFQGSAEVFESDWNIESYANTNTLYKANNEGKIKDYQAMINNFILSRLKPNMRLRILFEAHRRTIKFTTDEKELEKQEKLENFEIEAIVYFEAKHDFQRNDLLAITQAVSDMTTSSTRLYYNFKEKLKTSRFSSGEFMNLFSFFSINEIKFMDTTTSELKSKVSYLDQGQLLLDDKAYSKGWYVGMLDYPMSVDRLVYIPYSQLNLHTFVSGMAGSGKSAFIFMGAKDNIQKRVQAIESNQKTQVPGFSIFDPGKTLNLSVINEIRKLQDTGHDISELTKKVHYIDVTMEECGFAMNLLDKRADKQKLIEFIKDLFSSPNTIQVDRYFAYIISALLADTVTHTIADIKTFITSEDYRDKLEKRLLRSYENQDIVNDLKALSYKPSDIAPLLNRIEPFINDPKNKRLFGSTKNYLDDIRKWMDEGHIILFNLTDMSDFDIKVIVGYIALRFYQVAKTRPEGSLQFLYIIDEAHRVNLSILNKMYAELRKNGWCGFPTTQFLEQLPADSVKAIKNNVSTKIFMRQGSEASYGAVQMASKRIDQQSIELLPNLKGYIVDQNQVFKIKVSPVDVYHEGKLIEYNPDNKDYKMRVAKARQADEEFAIELMKRDYPVSKSSKRKMMELDEVEDELFD